MDASRNRILVLDDDRLVLELAPKHWAATRARLDPTQLDTEVGEPTVPEPVTPLDEQPAPT